VYAELITLRIYNYALKPVAN